MRWPRPVEDVDGGAGEADLAAFSRPFHLELAAGELERGALGGEAVDAIRDV